jgi:Uma2 family endonuclease
MAIQELTRPAPVAGEVLRLKMSFEEFMAWAEDKHAEWVEGEGIIFMPAKKYHQLVLGFLHQLMGLFVHFTQAGTVLVTPFAMRAEPDGPVREPDILFVAREHLARLTENLLLGPADLIVELISDESVRRDRHEKFHEYRQAGVREYWVIDPRPDRHRADFFRLDADGQYELFATEDDDRVDCGALAGFWLRPSWLWEVETRDPLLTFFEMRGLSPEQAQQLHQQLRDGNS